MIPKRRPRIRRTEWIEVSDAEIVDVTPKERSGTYPAVRTPPASSGSAPVVEVSVIDLAEDDDDAYDDDTRLNDVSVDLARLALATSSATVPRLRGVVRWDELSGEEAWLVSLVMARFDVHAILSCSPLREEDTLTLLSRLIHRRIVTLAP